MYVGTLDIDLLLDAHSLKEKRSVLRPVLADLRRRYAVAAAEADHLDLLRRAGIGVATVAADPGQVRVVLDACERHVAGLPHVQVLATRTRTYGPHD